jgi:hypothetical protein
MSTPRTAISYPLIAYIRVSTVGQGRSGLGIEAQREAIARFAEGEGLTILAEHIEVESACSGQIPGVKTGSPGATPRQLSAGYRPKGLRNG